MQDKITLNTFKGSIVALLNNFVEANEEKNKLLLLKVHAHKIVLDMFYLLFDFMPNMLYSEEFVTLLLTMRTLCLSVRIFMLKINKMRKKTS